MSPEEKVTAHLVSEVRKIITSQRTKYGDKFAKEIEAMFLAKYVADLATDSLVKFLDVKEKSKSRREYDLVAASFAELKLSVQEAIGAAFSGAMSQFTGKPVEYFCSLYPVAENVSNMQH